MRPGMIYPRRTSPAFFTVIDVHALTLERAVRRDLGVGEDPAAARWAGRLDVENYELDEVGDCCKGFEGSAPEDGGGDVGCMECGGVDEVDGVANAGAYC